MRFCLIVHNPPNLIEKVTQGGGGPLRGMADIGGGDYRGPGRP